MSRMERVRELFVLRFTPNRDLWALAISWVLVTGSLATATYVVSPANGGGYFIVYAILTAFLFGVGFPTWWMVWHRKRSIADLGVTTRYLGIGIVIQLILAAVQYVLTLGRSGVPEASTLLPLVALALCVGFFEAVFWRGWMLSRLEESFGFLPALVISSMAYSLYHIGYGMTWDEMAFLFLIGVIYACVFRITRSVFILWPILQPMGQLTTLLKDGGLQLPQIAILGFTEVLIAMFVLLFFASRHTKKISVNASATTQVSPQTSGSLIAE